MFKTEEESALIDLVKINTLSRSRSLRYHNNPDATGDPSGETDKNPH